MSVEVLLSLTSPIFLVVLLLGCFSCLFKKKGFQNFRPRDAHNAQNNPAFSVDVTDVANTLEQITIEPLPDILSKTSTAPCFKPRIVCKERGKQEAFLSLISVQRSFPRDHLTYIKEIGSGWFGQAIESEAAYLVEASTKTKVVVKILKDDASKLEQKQFMEEVTVFRCLDHVNVLSFLGQCTDALPYLVILEFSHCGNLKTHLIEHRHDKDKWIKKNRLIRFSLDVAAGLACLHRHDYVHNDLSARNCLVMANNAVKIGDYGISDTLFKDDYYNTGRELLPIRWMAPETLIQVDGMWTSNLGDKETDVWSFGILLWEIFTLGEQPYSMLRDEAVLQGVVLDKCVLPTKLDLKVPHMDQLWLVMAQCWQSPHQRLDIEQVHQHLEQIIASDSAATVTADISTDFDQKWQTLMPNRPELGSRTALAGSFLNEDSSSPTSVQSYLLGGELGAGDTPGLDEVLIGGQPDNDHKVEMELDLIVNQSSHLSESKPVTNSQVHLNLNNENPESQNSNGTSLAPLFIPQVNSSTTVEMPTTVTGSAKDPKDHPITVSITSNNTDQLLTSREDFSLSSQGFSILSGMEEGAGDCRKDNALTNESNNNLMNMHSTSFSLEDFTEFARTSPKSPKDDFTGSQFAVDSSEQMAETHNDFSEFVSSATKDIIAENHTESKDDFDEFVTFSQPPESQFFTENFSSPEILSDFSPFSKSESLPVVSEAKVNVETNVSSSHLLEVEKASDESNNNHHQLSPEQPPFSLLESVDDTIASLPSNPFFAVDAPDWSTNSMATNSLSQTEGVSDLTSDLNSLVGLGSIKQTGPTVAEVLGESEGIAALNSTNNILEPLQHRSSSDHFEPFDTKEEESKLVAGLEKVGTGSPCSLDSNHAKSVITFGGLSTDLNLSSIHSKVSAQPASSTCSDDFGQERLVDKYNFSPQSLLVPPRSSYSREAAEDDGSCRVLVVEYTDDSHENSTSPLDSDTEGSTCSSSSREYLCTGVSDTGQPPPTGEPPAETSEDHLDDKAYQLISEIYLSRGVKSPRVFEMAPLETIYEHHDMAFVEEASTETPSDSSSVEVKYEDAFGSDSYEWDDLYGDPMFSRDEPEQQQFSRTLTSHKEENISDWSLDMDQLDDQWDSPSNTTYQSLSNILSSVSRSDSSSSKQTLVSSLLTHLPTSWPSVASLNQSNLYSLTDDYQLETGSSSTELNIDDTDSSIESPSISPTHTTSNSFHSLTSPTIPHSVSSTTFSFSNNETSGPPTGHDLVPPCSPHLPEQLSSSQDNARDTSEPDPVEIIMTGETDRISHEPMESDTSSQQSFDIIDADGSGGDLL